MKKCKVKNCIKKHKAKGYCNRHYHQITLHGKILERTRFDPNKFIIKDDHCLIELYNQKNIVIAYTIISLCDVEKCKQHKWCLSGQYVGTQLKNRKSMLLHNFILNRYTGDRTIVCDHDDGNPSNNRRENLTIRSASDNIRKSKIQINNTSGYKNIYWHKRRGKWQVSISVNKKQKHLGSFIDIEDAKLCLEKSKYVWKQA